MRRPGDPMICAEEFWTPLGVRLRARRWTPGELNWLFLPGGAGRGSDSLVELVNAVDLPGTSWLVDLPGDGSNSAPPGAPEDPYRLWPDVFLEAVAAVPAPICVGHATGGSYLLSLPGLEDKIGGLVLISSAPDAGWLGPFHAMTTSNPLAHFDTANSRYDQDPSVENLRDLAVASAPWSFTPDGLAPGTEMLRRMPYNPSAQQWSTEHFDPGYLSSWWPRRLPTLIISGGQDRIVTQTLWDDSYYTGPHVRRAVIDGAGHFPWIERPAAVKAAFGEYLTVISATASVGPPNSS